MSPRQEQKYWRTWAKILACQGWAHESASKKDQRRKASHIMCGLKNEDGTARSMKSFGNRDFSRWLASTAHLCDEVDTRDRDRENAVWTIERQAAAFKRLLGHDYVRTLLIDLRDTEDLDKFPVEDPLRYMRDEDGKIDPRDAGRMRDLANLRNTLTNRLGRVIQRIRDGQLEPGPDCPDFYDHPQAFIIDCLIKNKPIHPRQRPSAPPTRKYTLDGGARTFSQISMPKEGQPMTPRQVTPATVTGPIPVAAPSRPHSYCTHAIRPPAGLPALTRGMPATTTIDEVAYFKDPDNEPF